MPGLMPEVADLKILISNKDKKRKQIVISKPCNFIYIDMMKILINPHKIFGYSHKSK